MARQRTHRHNSVRPILRRLHSPDLLDMQNDTPDDVESFCILVQAMIGSESSLGEESFNFIVCTIDKVAATLQKEGFLFGRHYLMVEYYNYQVIFDVIDSLCNRVSGSSWQEVAEKLGRYGHWEFEDYVEPIS